MALPNHYQWAPRIQSIENPPIQTSPTQTTGQEDRWFSLVAEVAAGRALKHIHKPKKLNNTKISITCILAGHTGHRTTNSRVPKLDKTTWIDDHNSDSNCEQSAGHCRTLMNSDSLRSARRRFSLGFMATLIPVWETRLMTATPALAMYSGSKNCPNVWLFRKDELTTN